MSVMKGMRIGTIAGVALGAFLLLLRPAPLRSARVTAVMHGTPVKAQVALRYGIGSLPVSVILEVVGQAGVAGSATVPGSRQFVEIPIGGPLDGQYGVRVTAMYRILGRLIEIERTTELAA